MVETSSPKTASSRLGRSAIGSDFGMKSLAPSDAEVSASPCRSKPLYITTRVLGDAVSTIGIASSPSMPAIEMSRSIRSGRCSAASATASTPFVPSPTTSKVFESRNRERTSRRMSAASSMSTIVLKRPNRTRATILPMKPRTIDELLEEARSTLDRVSPAALGDELATGALVVDIRPIEQRSRDGALAGAVVVDRNVLEWRLDPSSPHRIPQATGPERRGIVVCNEGFSSSLAAATLRQLGLERATDLAGGFQAWLRLGGQPESPGF